MDVKLEYCGNYIEIKNFKHFAEDERNGNPYNCLFDIKVKSGLFSGCAERCEADYKKFEEFADMLDELINLKIMNATFTEISYGNRISFSADRCGHITVSGDIFFDGDMMKHSLKFEFMTDQTIFPSFITALRNL